jgi:hypothetical protein
MFEDILNNDIPWPTTGTSLFNISDCVSSTAIISPDRFSRHHMMESGYKTAADILVEYAKSSRSDLDRLVYPIVFNYRQFLELSVKFIVARYGNMVCVGPNWKSHDLDILWEIFIKIICAVEEDVNREEVRAVARIYKEFAELDPNSIAFSAIPSN